MYQSRRFEAKCRNFADLVIYIPKETRHLGLQNKMAIWQVFFLWAKLGSIPRGDPGRF